jgi:WD40-like Beta Propeller Repeat
MISMRLPLLALGLVAAVWAQYPPETQWRTIRTAHFEVVFPREVEADAQRLANALETMYQPLSESLGARLPRHNTVLLANQGVTRYSGGFVSLMPRMATMQAMPMQGFWGTNDWINTLTVSEGRRLVQVAKINHGFGKVAYTLFGESGLALVAGWSMPAWWLAGDVRAAETGLLRGGVGQYASSETALRALLMSGQSYSFMKAMHGSLKDAVPSEAELGAFLVNHVERNAGPQSWDSIMARAARNSWNPFSVSYAMKKETGMSAAANFQQTMSQLQETWKSQAQAASFSRPQIINTAPKLSFTTYIQPVFEKDGSILAQKAGFDTYPLDIVRVRPDGKEQTVFRFAPTVNGAGRTSVVNGRIVWDEFVPDVRWQRSYSEILIRDMATGPTRRLTHGARFQNPVLSPDGARIAVVEFLPDRRCSLVILDANNGAELRRLPSPDNDMIYTPAWSEDGARLAMITQNGQGRALTVAELESGRFQDVIPHRDEELAHPVFFHDYILYKSSSQGIVNIFAARIADGQTFLVTWAQFGADFPSVSPDGTKLLYSDYTARGYNLAELPLDPASWKQVDWVAGPTSLGYQKNTHDVSGEIPATPYHVDSYRPSAHLFDVHSWGLTSGPPDLGFGLQSNDKMGLLGVNASFLYNTTEKTPGFETGLSYSRFFPVLYFDFVDRNRSLQYVDHTDHFTERSATAGFTIPLNFSRGMYFTRLSFGASVEDIRLQNGGLLPLNYRMGFSHIRQSAARDLAPAWSQILRVTYDHQVLANPYTANHLAATGRFAFPGLVKHQALVLAGGYERNDGSYLFSRSVLFPRGYTAYTGRNLTAFSSTYSVPLLYPDLAIGQLLYIKRVAGNAFYDYGKQDNQLYRSAGAELVFDVNLFHWPGFRVGVRESYRLDYRNRRLQPFVAFGW